MGSSGINAIAHAPVVHAAPVDHAAPAYHAPVVAHAAVEAYPDEVSPYTYNYAVADDYSASNFNAAESSDGTGNAEGSYSVALPDGRIQHVNYHTDDANGYVAEVTYDGTAVYPEAPVPVAGVRVAPVVHAAPVAVHATPVVHAAAPVYHARTAGQSSHQSVSKPYQGEARTTSQAKAFGSPIASVSS